MQVEAVPKEAPFFGHENYENLLFDASHNPDQFGQARQTLEEMHPIGLGDQGVLLGEKRQGTEEAIFGKEDWELKRQRFN